MVRFSVRLLFALALSAATFAPAGCVRGGYSPREAPGYVRPSAVEGLDARRPSQPLDIPLRVRGTLGAEVGSVNLRGDGWSDRFGEGVYIGVRYSRTLGLNWGLSFAAGQLSAPVTKDGEDDLEIYLTRCTLEYGAYIGSSLSRWYLGGGGGYTLSALGRGTDDNEWTEHAVIGVEFRNESIFATRIEGGHAWLEESGADHWTATVAISLQF